MKQRGRPPVWRMIMEAVEALGGATRNTDVRDWILKKYPGTNPHTVGCQIIICTVNHPSRIHYPENRKPRKATGQYDFLYRPDRGQLAQYDPERHGSWEIAEEEDGRLVVREMGREGEPPVEVPPTGDAFAAEKHLHEYLVQNLHLIEPGLSLFVDESGTDGVEYRTPMGRIDILAVDKAGGLVVVELKVGRGPDQVCGQIMRYMGWVKRHLAKGKPVRGVIIARHISERIRYALADVPGVTAREYELHITLRPSRHVDDQHA